MIICLSVATFIRRVLPLFLPTLPLRAVRLCLFDRTACPLSREYSCSVFSASAVQLPLVLFEHVPLYCGLPSASCCRCGMHAPLHMQRYVMCSHRESTKRARQSSVVNVKQQESAAAVQQHMCCALSWPIQKVDGNCLLSPITRAAIRHEGAVECVGQPRGGQTCSGRVYRW